MKVNAVCGNMLESIVPFRGENHSTLIIYLTQISAEVAMTLAEFGRRAKSCGNMNMAKGATACFSTTHR